MSAPTAAADRVSLESLLWVSACLTLTLLAGIATLPLWVGMTVAAVVAMRLVLAANGRDAPPRALRFTIAAVAIGLLFWQFRTFNGLAAGTALLSLMAGLKLLETRTSRDFQVITMIVYFLSLATLLESQSFWLLPYLIAVCWLTTATLLRVTSSTGIVHSQRTQWRGSLRYAGRLLAQALPLALAFWLFFPRFGGPLWAMPDNGSTATSGLSDSMSPGDITDLAQSDEIAFRVRFSAGTPPPGQRYWRGPVLHDFDGRRWHRSALSLGHADLSLSNAPRLEFQGPAYRYTVSLEPSQQRWLFALDWPAHWDAAHGYLTGDYMLMQPDPVSQPIDVAVTSYAQVSTAEPLKPAMRNRDTWLPQGRNPRSVRLAQEMRRAYRNDLDYVKSVLELFHTQAFFYTLRPPRLRLDSVDEFLFESRRGFCGHYASAFALLMRAAGIPARVVTGYQGGTYNRFADYWILRQSDAHAWDEVWIDGRGWLRFDPTSVIAPERIEHGLNDSLAADSPFISRWQQRTPWLTDTRLRIDALRLLWRQRILLFDQDSQERLLGFLHIPEPDGQKVALVLAVCLVAGLAWLTWQVRRDLEPRPSDPVNRAYRRLCRRMALAGLARWPHEGAEAFAARIATVRPDLARTLRSLCHRYSALRYAAAPNHPAAASAAAATFIAAVRAFRPRDFRGSSGNRFPAIAPRSNRD